MQSTRVSTENVLLNLEATTSDEALGKLADAMYHNGNVKGSYKAAVIEREHEYATALPTAYCSVAIPHTDVEHVIQTGIGVAVLKTPVPFVIMGEVSETTPVKLMFMLAMDKAEAQLALLQKLMGIFQNEILLAAIASAETPEDVASMMNEALTK